MRTSGRGCHPATAAARPRGASVAPPQAAKAQLHDRTLATRAILPPPPRSVQPDRIEVLEHMGCDHCDRGWFLLEVPGPAPPSEAAPMHATRNATVIRAPLARCTVWTPQSKPRTRRADSSRRIPPTSP